MEEEAEGTSHYMKHKTSFSSHFTLHTFDTLQLVLHENVFFIYPIQNQNRGVLLLMSHHSSFALHGKLIVQPLVGNFSVNGSILSSTKKYELYSPTSHSNLVIKSENDDSYINIHDVNIMPCFKDMFIESELKDLANTIDFVREFVNKNDLVEKMSILYASRVTKLSCNLISNFSSFGKIFHVYKGDPIGNSFGFSFINIKVDDYHVFKETSELKDIKHCLKDIQKKKISQSSNKPLCVFTVGSKNSGKSTLMRYITNQIQNNLDCQKVAWLDCDIGQPEFTPSGFVSLTLVEENLLGPPFTHQLKGSIQPIRQCFVGTVTPSDDPTFYSNCLRFVFEAYESLDPKPPLVVNTMGWVTGLGQLFLADQIFMTRPDLIIQIQVSNRKMNCEPLTNQLLQSISGWVNKDLRNEEFSHQLLLLNSVASNSSFGAPAHRELTLLSHLVSSLSNVPSCLPEPLLFPSEPTALGSAAWVQSRLPYVVSYCRSGSTPSDNCESDSEERRLLALYLIHPDVRPFSQDQLLPAFNASLVALCSVPDELIDKSSDPSLPHTLKSNPICNCLGVGIVRAIDPNKGVLYVITGVPQEDLTNVNCLVKGPSIDLPACLFQDQLNSESAPYIQDVLSCGIGKLSLPSKRFVPKVNKHSSHRSSHPI